MHQGKKLNCQTLAFDLWNRKCAPDRKVRFLLKGFKEMQIISYIDPFTSTPNVCLYGYCSLNERDIDWCRKWNKINIQSSETTL